jgi:hypothetical protein
VIAAGWLLSAASLALAEGQATPASSGSTTLTDITQVYVPADDLESILSRDKRGVLLPRREFAELLERARRNARETPDVPNGIAVVAADYRGKFVGSQLALTATVHLHQVVDGWRFLRLPFRGVAIESATFDGRPALLARGPASDSALHVFHDRQGPHTLVMELAAPVASTGGDRVAALGLGGMPMGTLEISVAAGERLLVDEVPFERPAPAGKAAVYHIPIGGKEEIRLRISDRTGENASDHLLFAETAYRLVVTPGDAAWQAVTSLQVFGSAVDRFTLTLPPGLKIAQIESTGLESWDVTEQTGRKPATIRLVYRQPFKGSRTISCKGIVRTDAGKRWTLGPLKIAGVTSHVGRIQIVHPGDLRLKLESPVQLRPTGAATERRLESSAAPGTTEFSSGSAPPLRFDAWNENFSLSLVTERKPRDVFVNMLTSVELSTSGVELQVAATLESLNGSLFESEITLPAEWSVTAVTVGGKVVDWRSLPAEAGTHHLFVPIDPLVPAGARVPLVLAARRPIAPWPIDEAGAEFALPEVRFLNAGVLVGSYVVQASEDFDLAPTDVTGLDPVPSTLNQERLKFRYQDTHFAGKLKITRRPSRLSAETVVVSRLDSAALRTFLRTTIEARGGGFRRLDLLLPESAGNEVRFRADRSDVRIVEQKVSEPVRGERLWTLTFDQYVKGTINLQAFVETPRGSAKEFRVPEPRLEGVARQSGYIVVQAAADQQMTVTALGPGNQRLAEVDLAELPSLPFGPDNRAVAAYRFVQPGNQVTLSETKFTPVAVPRAVCKLCTLETLLGKTGAAQHRANFRFVASGVQSLQITMPPEATVWSTLIDDRPVELRVAGNAYQVPLPPAAAPATERMLTLFYATPQASSKTTKGAAAAKQSLREQISRFDESPPEVSVIGSSEKGEAMEMLSRNWRLYLPADVYVTRSDGLFEPTSPLASASPLGEFARNVGAAAPEQIAWKLVYAAIAIGAIVLGVKGYLRWGVRGVVAAIAISASIVAIAALLFSPAVQSARESASRGHFRWEAGEVKSVGLAKSDLKNPSISMGERKSPAVPFSYNLPSSAASPSPAPGAAAGTPIADADAIFGVAKNAITLGPNARLAGVPLPKAFTGGGRLSVPVDFEIPEEITAQEFRFLGRKEIGQVGPQLDVQLTSRRRDEMHSLVILAVVGYLFWSVRRASPSRKALLVALGLTLPLALITIVPIDRQSWLDGIFLGTLGGLVLWCLAASVPWLFRASHSTTSRTKAASAAVLILSVLLSARSASASDPISPTALNEPTARAGRVILPYDLAKDPLSANHVFLEREAFLELWNRAHPEQPIGRRPPIDGVVTTAIYSAKIVRDSQRDGSKGAVSPESGAHAAVTGRLVLESFVDRPITVALPLRRVAFRTAKLDGQPALLIPHPEKQAGAGDAILFDVGLPARGIHLLDVEFDLAARTTGPAGQLTVPLLPVASGRFSLELPEGASQVQVTGAEAGFRKRQESGRQWIDIATGSGSELTIAWQPEHGPVSSVRSVEAAGTTAVSLEETGLRVYSRYRMHVVQGTASEFSFSLPPTLKLQQIRGGDVAGWKVEGVDPARKLIVNLRRNVSGDTRLEFDFFQALDVRESPTNVAAPLIVPLDVVRETGTVALYRGGPFDVRSAAVVNARQIDVREFPGTEFEPLAGMSADSAYRYMTRPVRLEWLVARRGAQTDVSARHAVIVGRRKLAISSRFRIEVSGTSLTGVAIVVPRDFLTMSVAGPGVSDWFVGDATGDHQTLAVEFASPQQGAFDLVLSGTVAKNPEEPKASLQVPALTEVRRARTVLAVWVDDSYLPTIVGSAGWKPITPQQIPEDTNQNVKSLSPQRPRFTFETVQPQPNAVVLNLSHAAPRLSGDSATIVTVTDTSVFYTLALRWTIAQAGADTFTVTTPGWLAGRLDFIDPHVANSGGPRLRQITSAKLPDGRIQWTIFLQDPVRAHFFVVATAVLSLPADAKIAAPSLTFESEKTVGDEHGLQPLVLQRHFVVLVNQSAGQLASLSPDAVQTVERDEIPIDLDAALLKQAMFVGRFVRPDATVAWQIERSAVQKGAPAFVNLAELVTVVEHSGTWRTQAVYRIKNFSRQFLAVQIPPESEILSVYVQDKPSRPVALSHAGQALQLVPLPAVSQADLSFEVRMVVGGRLSSGLLPSGVRLWAETLPLPVPQVHSLESDRDYGMAVLRTRWTIYFPQNEEVHAIDDAKLTNVDASGENESALLERSAVVDEVKQLFSVLESESNSKTNYQALRNLKTLQGKLDREGGPPAGSERDLGKKIGEYEARFKSDEQRQVATPDDKQAAVEFFNPDVQAKQAKTLLGRNSANVATQDDMDIDGVLGGNLGPQTQPQLQFEFRQGADEDKGDKGLDQSFIAKALQRRKGVEDQSLNKQLEAFQTQERQQQAPKDQMQAGDKKNADTEAGNGRMTAGDQWAGQRTPGSLSLAFDIPTDGRKLVFTKVGGDPKLALVIRPRRSFEMIFSVAWMLVWGCLGVAVVVAAGRGTRAGVARKSLPRIVMGVALVVFLLEPASISWLGLAILAVAAAVEALRQSGRWPATQPGPSAGA